MYARSRLLESAKSAVWAGSPFIQLEGRRHFWVATHDVGKMYAAGWDTLSLLLLNASVLAHSASREQITVIDDGPKKTAPKHIHLPTARLFNFSLQRDISLSCNANIERAKLARRVHFESYASRRYSIFYAGLMQNAVRRLSVASLKASVNGTIHGRKQKDRSFLAPWHQMVIAGRITSEEYIQYLRETDFCLCPRGSMAWSPRLFEAIWFGCIPVILADDYYLPGRCIVDWSEIAVIIPENDANNTADILLQLRRQPLRVASMRDAISKVRHHFMWDVLGMEGDAYDLALLELYAKLHP